VPLSYCRALAHYWASDYDWLRCAGIHLNTVVALPDPDTLDDLSVGEQAALIAAEHYAKWGTRVTRSSSRRARKR
jgi:hypothetical protein